VVVVGWFGCSGDVLLNGRKPDGAMKKYTAFVQQADLFYRSVLPAAGCLLCVTWHSLI
jgi:hypothetical protein